MSAMLPYGARHANIHSRYSKVPSMRSNMVSTEGRTSGTLPEVQEPLLEQAKAKAKVAGSVPLDVMDRFFSKTIAGGDCLRWGAQKDSFDAAQARYDAAVPEDDPEPGECPACNGSGDWYTWTGALVTCETCGGTGKAPEADPEPPDPREPDPPSHSEAAFPARPVGETQ